MSFSVNVLLDASVLRTIGGVLLAILILLAMVTIHEFGHYVAGKILGFKINEFSVGFGPAIFKKRSKKTGELFALRIIPLGGYCAFDGEDEEETPAKAESVDEPFAETLENKEAAEAVENVEEKPLEEQNEGGMVELKPEREEDMYPEPKGVRFNDQAPWKRIIVLLAGATMNYLLALFLIVIMFAAIGRPVYRVQVEYPEKPSVETTATVERVNEVDNPYLQTGDLILEIDGKAVYLITDYIDVLNNRLLGEEIPVKVVRNGQEKQVTLVLKTDTDFVNMSDTDSLLKSMGIYGLATTSQKQSFFPTIGHSFVYSVKIGSTVLRSLGELLTGKMGLEAMGGPVTTIKVTSQAAASGWLSFLNIAAFIGVNLAVFNLLPIPALDGCKVIFCIIEWIRKKPVDRKVEAIIHFVGIIFLFTFAIFVDLLQLRV